MGRTAGMAMGFKHHHVMTCSGTQGSTAQTANTAANHDHLSLGGHGVIRSVTGQFIAGRR
jgi:hypothetical protein